MELNYFFLNADNAILDPQTMVIGCVGGLRIGVWDDIFF